MWRSFGLLGLFFLPLPLGARVGVGGTRRRRRAYRRCPTLALPPPPRPLPQGEREVGPWSADAGGQVAPRAPAPAGRALGAHFSTCPASSSSECTIRTS